MSKTLSSVASKQFDTEVKAAYQGVGKLKNTVTIRTGVVGDTYNFRAMGKGLATERTAPSSDSIPMNVDNSLIACTLKSYDADEYTDIFDKHEVNFSEVAELAFVIASALGRREDQAILDALTNSSTSKTVGVDIGGTGTGMNVDKIRRAAKLLNDDDIPMSDRYFVISSGGLDSLLNETEVTSEDYNSVKALVNGSVDSFMGFKFIMIGTRSEGGLPYSNPNTTGYAFHKSAVGFAEGMAPATKVDWIAHKKSWLSAGSMKSGCIARDAKGIVAVTYKEVI